MPLYTYRCEDCHATAEERKPGKERYDAPVCCGKRMKLTITAPALAASRDTEGKA